jgi:hypothetical protein
MATVPTTRRQVTHPFARLAAVLLRRRYAEGDPAPCTDHPPRRLIADPREPAAVACPRDGRHFPAAA